MTEWVAIAILGRARGNRGELTALPLSDRPERYEDLREVFVFGDGRRYEVESTWWHGRRLIFKFRGVDSISDAETLEGAEVRVPAGERAPLEPGAYYQSDLLGFEVIERGCVEPLGSVTGWQDCGSAPLLELGNGMLIPFAKSICVDIDVAARRIWVVLPEGLKELNR